MTKSVRVLVADDHEVVRDGVRALIERQPDLEVCGLAATGREAVDLAQKTRPDVVVLDMTMPELDGLDAIRQIKKALPETEVVVFSAHPSEDILEDVFDAGAKSYIEKTEASRDLVTAIRSLAEHKPFFTSQASKLLFAKFLVTAGQKKQPDRAKRKLTPRESEIVRLLAQGSSNKDIATTLGISIRTVETHRATLMHKLDVRSVAGVVRYAIRHHIIEP